MMTFTSAYVNLVKWEVQNYLLFSYFETPMVFL